MMIGIFRMEGDGYTGQLDALGLSVSAMDFRPVRNKKAGGPDFIVIGCGQWDETAEIELAMNFAPGETIPNPNSYEIGAAWKKTSKKGVPYLSVKLDGPTLTAPITCALVGRKDGTFRLIWSRKENKNGLMAEEEAA